jgi:hypothetical protein
LYSGHAELSWDHLGASFLLIGAFKKLSFRRENGSSLATIFILASSVQRFDALCSSCHRIRDMANIKRGWNKKKILFSL